MNEIDNDKARSHVTFAVDSIPVPPGPGRLAASAPPPRTLAAVATVALAAAFVVALVAAFAALRADRTVVPAAPSAATPSPAATATPKADRSTSPVAAPATRARWFFTFRPAAVPATNEATLIVQPEAPDGSRTAAKEVRIVDGNGAFVAAAPIRLARPEEPRICGSADVVPPLVAALSVPQSVVEDFAPSAGAHAYGIEVREGSTWHRVTPVAWGDLPEQPCTATGHYVSGPSFTFAGGNVTFCEELVSYRAPTATVAGELRMGGTTFEVPFAPDASDQQVAPGLAPGTWSCVRGLNAALAGGPGPRRPIVGVPGGTNLLRSFSVAAAGAQPLGGTIAHASACGVITDVDLRDLPSGEFVELDRWKFQVGGVRRTSDEVVHLPSTDTLRPGASACIENATFAPQSGRSYYVAGGAVGNATGAPPQ